MRRSAGIAQFEAGCRQTRRTRDSRTSHGPDWEVIVSANKCPPVRNAMQVVKTVLITLWISAATLGTMYGVAWLKASSAASADGGGIRADFKTKTLSIPVFTEGKVTGYAILRFEGAIDAAFAASANPPLEVAQAHAAYAAFQTLGAQIDMSRPKSVDREAVSEQLSSALDRIAGHPVADRIVVTQLDFLQRQKNPAGG